MIISCDDLGLCHAANVGVYTALRDGAATCSSLMVPAPWSRHAAAMYEESDDIGVHLTLNAEHESYRWGPITQPRRCSRATAASPARSTTCGSTPTRRRSGASAGPRSSGRWRGASTSRTSPRTSRRSRCAPSSSTCTSTWPSSSACPIRLPSTISAEQAGFPFRRLAAEEGVVFPDHFDHDWRAGSRDRLYAAIRDLQPGVTEIHVQPAIDTPEVRALSPAAEGWIDDLELVTEDAKLPALLAEMGAVLIGYSELRDVQRASVSCAAASPERNRSNNGPVGPDRLQLAAHERDGRVEPVGRDDVERHGDDELGIVGALDALVLLADDDAVLDGGHRPAARTCSRTPAKRSSSSGPSGIGPTSERARIQSSQG